MYCKSLEPGRLRGAHDRAGEKNLKLSAHQPLYFGWLGLYDKICQADTFVIFDDVQYDPNDWQNRNRIRVRDGVQLLTVPVFHKGYQDGLKIKDVKINNVLPWQRKHLRSIEIAYRTAPYFDNYFPAIQHIIGRDWARLSALDEMLLRWIIEQLAITTKIVKASDYNFKGRKSALVLDMCKKLGADRYIFGSQGRDYADVEAFETAGIEVSFQQYQHPRYVQQYDGFEPNMCVLDALLCLGGQAKRGILGGVSPSKTTPYLL